MADHGQAPAPGRDAAEVPRDHRMQRWITVTLIGGVLISGLLIGAGLLVLLSNQPGNPTTAAALIEQETHTTSLDAIFTGVAVGRATSLIRLGVFALILTPVARVALTLAVFLTQRDWIFVGLTALVLALLLLGITGVVG